jgi:hypothetical protein
VSELHRSANRMEPPRIPTQEPVVVSSIYHGAATYGVIAVPASIALTIVAPAIANPFLDAGMPMGGRIVYGVPGIVLISAVPAGIAALCGIAKYGTKKLLWKGLVSVLVPLVLLLLALPLMISS